MATKEYSLRARVSTENPAAVAAILQELFPGGSVKPTRDPKEFLVEGRASGDTARELNRSLLSALRRAEKRTRLRSEWTLGSSTERFFDYVAKGKRSAADELSSPGRLEKQRW